jgi:hypothetical protein
MASPDVAPVLAKEFVSLKIEAGRMVGGKEILTRYQADAGGIPWFVFLDGDGKAGVTTDGPKDNVGFPAAPHEIAHFRTMLEQSKRKLSDADISALVVSLEAADRK